MCFLTLLLLSCGKNETKTESITNEVTKTEVHFTQDTTQTNYAAGLKWNAETVIGEGNILRWEEVEGSNKWDSIQVVNVFGFEKNVPLGNLIQIIPLAKDLPTIGLKVNKTVEREGFEENGSDKWFEVHPENILNKEYWTFEGPKTRRAEYPVDVLIVYPPVKGATLLDASKFHTTDIPSGITNNIIKGAIDFDDDGLPDAIVCEFCCSDKKSAENCEYTCGETYLKIDNKWVMIYDSSPA